jgi:hypothetical protein
VKDREALIWLHERLVRVHDESPLFDYMHKLRAIILATPAEQETPNLGSGGNSIKDVLEAISPPLQDNGSPK